MLDSLEPLFSLLPGFLQPTAKAILYVIFGYFIAKVVAALASSIFNFVMSEGLAQRTAGLFFWMIWLIFILLGLSAFTLFKSTFLQWHPAHISLIGILPILAVSLPLFFLLPKDDGETYPKIEAFHNFLQRGKGPTKEFLPRLVYLALFGGGAYALYNPSNILLQVVALAAGLFLAWIVAKCVREIIRVFWDDETAVHHFAMCLILATVIVGFGKTFLG